MAKWLKANPKKRERNRIKNIKWRRDNKEKYLAIAARYRKNNRHKIKDYKLRVSFGITLDDYLKMHKRQGGLCAICKLPEKAKHNHTKKIQRLAVDHCHKTGKVRALLCQDCNRGLGKFFDDPVKLKAALDYVIEFNSDV